MKFLILTWQLRKIAVCMHILLRILSPPGTVYNFEKKKKKKLNAKVIIEYGVKPFIEYGVKPFRLLLEPSYGGQC